MGILQSCSFTIIFLGISVSSIEQLALQNVHYERDGDVIFGGLFPVHRSDEINGCDIDTLSINVVEYVQAMVYAVEDLNNRSDILPGIRIGFSILDTCGSDMVALNQALKFLPSVTAHGPPLVGVIGATYSSCSVQVANLLRAYNIVQISAASTTHTLHNHRKYPNFFRTVQSDIYQAQMFVEMMKYWNWTYVSMVYSEGPLTQAVNTLRTLANQNGICFAVIRKIHDTTIETMDKDIRDASKEINKFPNATVVLVFADGEVAFPLVTLLYRYRVISSFIFVFAEAVNLESFFVIGYQKLLQDSFSVGIYSEEMPDFHSYIEPLTINSTDNPYLKLLFEDKFNCLFNHENETKKCDEKKTMKDIPNYSRSHRSSLYFDAASALGHALHNLINSTCPNAFLNTSVLSDCVTGEKMIHFMQNVSYQGKNGLIYFDEYGDVHGKYVFQQLQDVQGTTQIVPVGIWDRASDHIGFNSNIRFPSFTVENNSPISICSLPCEENESYVYLENVCCWNCKACRKNEYLTNDKTECNDCEVNYWPNDTYDGCEKIEPHYIQPTDSLGTLLILFITLGITVTILVSVVLLKYRHRRLVKASSKEMSSFILCGILVAYFTVICYVVPPTDAACVAGYVMFHLSFTMIYGTLLLKTQRVYRVFAAGRKGKSLPKLVSNRSQVILLMFILAVLLAVVILSVTLLPPKVKERMPDSNVRKVEKYCDTPLATKVPPLSFNMALLLMTSVLAFRTRNLPENFNESRFIFLLVSATLFLWIAFVVLYFVATFGEQKIMLLSLTCIANASTVLVCLFIPKVYALFYVEDKKMRIMQFSVSHMSVDGKSTTLNAVNTKVTCK